MGNIEYLQRWGWLRFKTRLFTLLISGQFNQAGRGCRISPPFRFANLHQISLGENVIIHPDCWVHTVGLRPEARLVKLEIRAGAGIGMGSTIAAAESVVIGERVMLARNVYIADHAHAYQNVSVPIADQGLDTIKPVSIGRGTWLGQNAVVLPGVSIGENCVVGANSVVNRSIADFSVAVGAPAQVVKRYNRSRGQWEKVS